jgi:hypothetical protein
MSKECFHKKIGDQYYRFEKRDFEEENSFEITFFKCIDEKYAYLVDSNGIVWVYNARDQLFDTPCLGSCLSYIVSHDRELDELEDMRSIWSEINLKHEWALPEYYEHILRITRGWNV